MTVVTSVPNAPNGVVYDGWRNRFWPQREQVDGIEVIRVWTYLAANSGNIRRIINFLSFFLSAVFVTLFYCRRPDVIVATSPQFFCGWAGVFASWLKWRPLVLEVRDIWPDSIVTVGAMRKGLVIRLLEVLEKWMYRSARSIVAVTEGLKTDILNKVPKIHRITVVTNGVDLERFPLLPRNDDFLSRWGLVDRFVCAYVGTIGMAHGLRVVLDAAAHLQQEGRHDIGFLIVGDGAEKIRLAKECEDRGLSESVKFSGIIPKDQVPVALASADTLLIHLKKTSLFESAIPSKVFEAMAMNKPLLVGVNGELAPIIEKAGCGSMFEPENARELADRLKEMVDHPDARIMMEQSGRKFVSQHYSRSVLAKKMLEWIQDSCFENTGNQ